MIAAIGVGLSGILTRPLFSIVLSYLVVAALSIGSLIAFGLAGLVTQSEARSTYIGVASGGEQSDTGAISVTCLPPQVSTTTVPRYDYWWAILVANPYVVLADAVPATFDESGFPQDLFGSIKVGRALDPARRPTSSRSYDECAMVSGTGSEEAHETPEQTVQDTTPGWFVGLAIHLLLAAAALVGAWAKTNTPARRLAKGSRIA